MTDLHTLRLISALFAALILQVQSITKIAITLSSYTNPTGTLYDGTLCPSVGCSYLFYACLDGSASTSCPQAQPPDTIIFSGPGLANSIKFPANVLQDGTSNPIILTSTTWTGSIPVKIVVISRALLSNGSTTANLVDVLQFNFTQAVPNFNQSVTTSQSTTVLTGTRTVTTSTSMPVTLVAYCDVYYFGPTCAIFCQYTDNCLGHYSCDSQGNKICFPGWDSIYCQHRIPAFDKCPPAPPLPLFPPTNPCSQLNLLWILDASGSMNTINPSNYGWVKAFVNALAEIFPISPTGTLMGVVIFGNNGVLKIKFNSASTTPTFQTLVNALNYPGQRTNVYGALDTAAKQGFLAANGARSFGKNIAVFITDGEKPNLEFPLATIGADELRPVAEVFGLVLDWFNTRNQTTQMLDQYIVTAPFSSHLWVLHEDFSTLYNYTTTLRDAIYTACGVTPPTGGIMAPNSPSGAFLGNYSCDGTSPPAVVTLIINIYQTPGISNNYFGEVDYTLPGPLYGSFYVVGFFDPSVNALQLNPTTWINQPTPNSVLFGLKGFYNASLGTVIGTTEGISQCGGFVVEQETGNSYCMNGGTCTPYPLKLNSDQIYCCCLPAFTGQFCQTYVNPCANNPCLNSGTCTVNNVTQFTCACAAGYYGPTCGLAGNNVTCATAPCLNGGTCSNSAITGYKCACAANFAGVQCQQTVAPCAPNFFGPSCNIYCVSTDSCAGHYTCDSQGNYVCNTGWTGVSCTVAVSSSTANTACPVGQTSCQNGGSCFGGQCCCVPGFTGPLCATQIRLCENGPCQNGGKCTDLVNAYSCTCTSGFTGTNCTANSGTCTASDTCNGHYMCDSNGISSCATGWSGNNCTIPVNQPITACPQSIRCHNGGTCFNQACCCIQGFTGPLCDTQMNPCLSSPCLNGGQCINNIIAFDCQCVNGFTGFNCATSPSGGTLPTPTQTPSGPTAATTSLGTPASTLSMAATTASGATAATTSTAATAATSTALVSGPVATTTTGQTAATTTGQTVATTTPTAGPTTTLNPIVVQIRDVLLRANVSASTVEAVSALLGQLLLMPLG